MNKGQVSPSVIEKIINKDDSVKSLETIEYIEKPTPITMDKVVDKLGYCSGRAEILREVRKGKLKIS